MAVVRPGGGREEKKNTYDVEGEKKEEREKAWKFPSFFFGSREAVCLLRRRRR